jgi:phosphopantothenoylcysteine decarboxylase/phosphopantothenate--cysteine ligase
MPSSAATGADATLRLLVTAGPTHEPIDAVRYIGNRSSGRFGVEIALDGVRRGWPVTLLLGPVPLPVPDEPGLTVVRFRTTDQLQSHLETTWPAHDVLVMAAAVADHRPIAPVLDGKLPRRPEGEDGLTLELEPTPDLVQAAAADRRADQHIVAFALEEAGVLHARAAGKLARKGVDAILANALETMDAHDVDATLLLADGETLTPGGRRSKRDVARWLLDVIATRWLEPTQR